MQIRLLLLFGPLVIAAACGGSTESGSSANGGGAGGRAVQGGAGGMMGGAGGVPIVASKCAQAACQDFEADLDPAVWSTSFSGGAIKVVKDAVTALHGTGSSLQLHLLKNPVEGAVKAFVTLKTVPDAVKNGGGDLYARFYTYFSVSHDSRHT